MLGSPGRTWRVVNRGEISTSKAEGSKPEIGFFFAFIMFGNVAYLQVADRFLLQIHRQT